MENKTVLIIVLGLLFNVFVIVAYSKYVRRLGKIAPPPVVETCDIDLDDPNAKKRFANVDGRVNGIFLLLSIIIGVMLYFAADVLGDLRMRLLPPSLLSYPVTGSFYTLVALLAGVGLAAIAIGLVMRRWWPDDLDRKRGQVHLRMLRKKGSECFS
jgi:hypothetical protein